MNKHEYAKNIKDVIYLSYCSVKGKIPSAGRIAAMDIDGVRKAAEDHMLSAICSMALESAGIIDEELKRERGNAQRNIAVMDVNKTFVLSRFESEGIWYMPLKGSVLKNIYPRIGMRQMCDVDILIDASRADDVKQIMESLGYSVHSFGYGIDDDYYKLPISNFEMHRGLFGPEHDEKLFEYYKNIKEKLIKDEENEYGYHFSNEDFYIYITAHEYKHYSESGIGLRAVLDAYVYLSKFLDDMDIEYIEAECKKLGIYEFEKQSRSLALDLFGGKKLTKEDNSMLNYIVFSGTFGNFNNFLNNKLDGYGRDRKGKLTFVFRRFFPTFKDLKMMYPFVYKHKILLPFLFFYRIGKGLTVSRKKIKTEIKALLK